MVTWTSARAGELLLPIPVTQRDKMTLGSGDVAVVIRAGCNGLEAVFLLLAGILAFPATRRQRATALLLYLPLVFVANVLRVLMLLFVMSEYPRHIDLFHYQVGQGVMIVLVIGLWVRHVRQISP
jgi:exosortase/archaeosortase family protein